MTSTTANRHQMRCLRCMGDPGKGSGRFTIAKAPEKYVRGVKCPSCGERNRIQDCTKYRRAEVQRQKTCCCSGYPFPHREGSLRFCKHHPMIDVPPTEDEIHYYNACLETPRSR